MQVLLLLAASVLAQTGAGSSVGTVAERIAVGAFVFLGFGPKVQVSSNEGTSRTTHQSFQTGGHAFHLGTTLGGWL